MLYEKCIPVKKNNIWELFDQTGKKITKEQYDDLGCSAGSTNLNDKNTNNILLVPKYEGIVVKKKEMYGLIDADGKQLLPIALQSIYSTISAGEETYHMIYNDQEMNVITYIETYVRPKQQENNPQTENTIAFTLIRMLIINVLIVGVDRTTHPRITAGITTEKLTLLKTFTFKMYNNKNKILKKTYSI